MDESILSPPSYSVEMNSRNYRRYVTDKWGYVSFALSILLMALVVVNSRFMRPLLVSYVNMRPSRWLKTFLERPWFKITMWALTALLTFSACIQTNSLDLVFVAKRLGRQAVALMPAMYLLTVRPALLPQVFYLQLVAFHKFLSRVVVLISLLHGLFYTIIYFRLGTLEKLAKMANLLGIGALLVFVAMAVLSVVKVRRWAFELFYQSHVIGAWICVPMLRYHSRPRSDLYLGLCGVLLLYQVAAKVYYSYSTRLRVQFVSPTLLLVTIPKQNLKFARPLMHWRVASHIRLSGSVWYPQNWIRSSHPYTIASLPEDGELKLVIRPGDYKIKMRENYTLFGPHRSVPDFLLQQIKNLMVRRSLLVIGGAGIAFGAPMMRYLRLHGGDVRMVFVMRDPYDARVLPQLGLHEEVLAGNIEIFYTGEALGTPGNNEIINEDQNLTIDVSESTCGDEHGTTIQSATRHPGAASRKVRGDRILSDYAVFMNNSRPHLNLRLKSWLYGYSTNSDDCCCADRVIESCPEDRLGAWVMACGNSQLNHMTERWARAAGVSYFQDTFSL